MAGRPRRNHGPVVKAKVALAAVAGERTLSGWMNSLTFIRPKLRPCARSCSKGPSSWRSAILSCHPAAPKGSGCCWRRRSLWRAPTLATGWSGNLEFTVHRRSF